MIFDDASLFADDFAAGGALIGLDLGTKTIGVATCDAGWRFATANKTLPRGKFGRDCEGLLVVIAERKIEGIVLDYPAIWMVLRVRANRRHVPMPATWQSELACRSCYGTSAGQPSAPNAT